MTWHLNLFNLPRVKKTVLQCSEAKKLLFGLLTKNEEVHDDDDDDDNDDDDDYDNDDNDDGLDVLRSFQYYLSHIETEGGNERLSAIKCYTFISRILPPERFEPGTTISEVASANHSSTRMLRRSSEVTQSKITD